MKVEQNQSFQRKDYTRIVERGEEPAVALPLSERSFFWCSPLIGYPAALLFVAAAFLIPGLEAFWGIHDLFIVPPFVIATILVAWIWGTGRRYFRC